MDYEMLVYQIRKHVKYVYDYRIRYNLKAGKDLFVERKNILSKIIPAMGGDISMFEIRLEKMYEDGYIVKDDGHTLVFSEDFVFN